jgi:hypothetical protein
MTSVCGDGFNVGAQKNVNLELVDICHNGNDNDPRSQGKDFIQCEQRFIENAKEITKDGETVYNGCKKEYDNFGEKTGPFNCVITHDCKWNDMNTHCPSCGDLNKYTLVNKTSNKTPCTNNFVSCHGCLNGLVDFHSNFDINRKPGDPWGKNTTTYNYNNKKYKEICPKSGSYVGKEYTECDDTKSECINDLQSILTVEMNSTGKCSINDIYTKIKNASGELSLNCNGNNNINGEEAWLDETLGNEYCKPVNASWKCTRDIPEYCKNGQCVLTGDTDNKKCGCPKGTLIDKYGKCTKACPEKNEKNKFIGGLAPGKTSCFPLTAVNGIKCEDYYAGDNESNYYMCSGKLFCTEDKDKPCAIKPKP